MKLDFEQFKALIKSYIRSVVWLTLVCWAPSHTSCFYSRLFGNLSFLTSILSLFTATLGFLIDTASHRFETGLFLAPRVLEIIYNMLLGRGMIFWDNVKNAPRFSAESVQKFAMGITFGTLALSVGVDSKKDVQVGGIIQNVLKYMWETRKEK